MHTPCIKTYNCIIAPIEPKIIATISSRAVENNKTKSEGVNGIYYVVIDLVKIKNANPIKRPIPIAEVKSSKIVGIELYSTIRIIFLRFF